MSAPLYMGTLLSPVPEGTTAPARNPPARPVHPASPVHPHTAVPWYRVRMARTLQEGWLHVRCVRAGHSAGVCLFSILPYSIVLSAILLEAV